jgi:hypothetical protein
MCCRMQLISFYPTPRSSSYDNLPGSSREDRPLELICWAEFSTAPVAILHRRPHTQELRAEMA